jgi:hypothetical protein
MTREAGCVEGKNRPAKRFAGEVHSERAWSKRAHIPLKFFLKR